METGEREIIKEIKSGTIEVLGLEELELAKIIPRIPPEVKKPTQCREEDLYFCLFRSDFRD